MKLNVGCGRNIMEGWVNIDSVKLPGVDHVVDLDAYVHNGDSMPQLPVGHGAMPIPVESVDEFLLSHVIEHMRHPLQLMSKLWWLAKPGATMVIRCPHGASDDADEDPTHVRRMFPGSFGYFGQPYYWRADYGYRGDWMVDKIDLYPYPHISTITPDREVVGRLLRERNIIQEMVVTLHAIKPRREPLRELQRYVIPNIVR